jgi:hypothetical protein
MERLYKDEKEIPDSFWAVHNRIKEALEKINEEVLLPSYFQ